MGILIKKNFAGNSDGDLNWNFYENFYRTFDKNVDGNFMVIFKGILMENWMGFMIGI